MSDCVPARSAEVTVDVVGDEAMVYDAAGHSAHALTAVAGRVLERCDGHTVIADVARELHLHPGEVSQIIGELAGLGLVDGDVDGEGLSRRGLLQRGALVGGGIVVASIAVPMAAAHASGDTTPVGPIAGQGPTNGEFTLLSGYGTTWGQTVTVPAGTVITGFSFDHPVNYYYPSTVTFNLWDPGATSYYSYQDLGAPVVSVTQAAPSVGTPLSVTFPGYTVTDAGPVTFTVVANNGLVGVSYTLGAPGLTEDAGFSTDEYRNFSAVFTLYGQLGGTTANARRAAVAQTGAAPAVIASQAATGQKPPAGTKLPGQLRGPRPGGKPGP